MFDYITFEVTGDIRASIFVIIQLSKDNKSLLLGHHKLGFIRKSVYPNSKEKVDKNSVAYRKVVEDFKESVKKLPSTFNVLDKENQDIFLKFFLRWGHFVVTKAYGGGCIEIKINT